MSDETVRILVFSDDKDKRAAVINGIGLRASKDTPRIEGVEDYDLFGRALGSGKGESILGK